MAYNYGYKDSGTITTTGVKIEDFKLAQNCRYTIYQVTVVATIVTCTVALQGRAAPDGEWVTMDTIVQTELSALTPGGTFAAIVQSFPEMRINVTTLTGGGSQSLRITANQLP